jgi:hypothetical protein
VVTLARKAKAAPAEVAPSVVWSNRIVGYGEEDPNKLISNDKNWRRHPDAQKEALSGILRDVGIVQNVIVNRRSGKVMDGHARIELAIGEKQDKIPVTYVDLTEEEEARVLASFDTLGLMAQPDPDALTALISGIELGSDPLSAFIGSLSEGAAKAQLSEVTDSTREPGWDGISGLANDQIKILIVVKELLIVEKAIGLTGEKNRGRALAKICQSFLDRAGIGLA